MGEEEGCASDILELELAPFRDLHERARARESDEGGERMEAAMKFKGGGRFVLTSCNKCHLSVARPRAVVTRDGRCARFLDTRRGTPILPSFRLVVSNNDQESSRFSRVMLFFPNSLYYSTRFCLFCRVRRFL